MPPTSEVQQMHCDAKEEKNGVSDINLYSPADVNRGEKWQGQGIVSTCEKANGSFKAET